MDDNPMENNQNGSSKKFKPFKAFKRMFRDGKKANNKRSNKENSTEEQGTSELTVRLNRPLSLSHDSIFTAEIVMPESKRFGGQSDICLSEENLNEQKDSGKEKVSQLQNQLKLKFGQGKSLSHLSPSETLFSSAPSIIITKDEDAQASSIDIEDETTAHISRNKTSMNEAETQENDEKTENKEVSFDTMDNESTEVLSNAAAYSKISSRPKNRRRGGKPPSMRKITAAPTFDSMFEQVTEERLVAFKENDESEQNQKEIPGKSEEQHTDEKEEVPSAPIKKSLSFKNHLGNPMMAPSLGDMQKIKLRKTNSSASSENRPQLAVKSPTKEDSQKSPKKLQKSTSFPVPKDEKSSAKSKGKKMNFFSKKESEKKPKKGKEKKVDTGTEEVFESTKNKEKNPEKEEKSSLKEVKKENLLSAVDKRRRAVSSESEKPKKSAPFKNSSFNGAGDIKLKKVDVKQRKSSEEEEDSEPQGNMFFKLKKVGRSDSGKENYEKKRSPKTSESSEKISSPSSPKKALIPPSVQKSKKFPEKPREEVKLDEKSPEKNAEPIKSPESEGKRPGLKFGPVVTPKKSPTEEEPIKSPEIEGKRPGLKFGPVVTPKKSPTEEEPIKSPEIEGKRPGLKFGPVVTPKTSPTEEEPIKSPESEGKRPGLKFGPVVTPKKDPSEDPLKLEMGKLKSKPEVKSPDIEKPQPNTAFPVKLKSTGHSKRLYSTEENNNEVKPHLNIGKDAPDTIQKPVERKISHNRNSSNNNITLVESVKLNNAESNDEMVKPPAAKTPPKVPKKPTINRSSKYSQKKAGKEISSTVEKENIITNKSQSEKRSSNKDKGSQDDGNAPSWVSLARKRSKKWETSEVTPIEDKTKEVKEPQNKFSVATGKVNSQLSIENDAKPTKTPVPRAKPRINQNQAPKSFEDKPSVPSKTARPVSDGASLVSLNPVKPSRSLSFKVRTEEDDSSPPPWLAIAMKKQKRWGKEEMV